MTPDLVERVAWIIDEAAIDYEGSHTDLNGTARAVIAIVLEEAETACRKRYMGDNNREDMEVLHCVDAIRALKGDE